MGVPKGKGKTNPLREIPPDRKVWVGGLPENLAWKELEAHFTVAEQPKWVEVMPRGTACIAYNTSDEASTAILALNGSELGGAVIQVDSWTKDTSKSPKGASFNPAAGKGAAAPRAFGKGALVGGKGAAGPGLFASNLLSTAGVWNPTMQKLAPASLFMSGARPPVGFGKGKGKAKGKGKGKDRPLAKIDASLKVWVGNVASSVTWKELEELFKQVGETKWAEIMPKGTACVAYKTEEEAAAALGLTGSELGGQAIEVDVWETKKSAPADIAI